MFDTTMIGKRIKQARIDKNMTQLALADAMGVSYQAVSNWERGNSMPDISKLGDLCAALDISVNALLGLEETAPNAVKKAMDQEELTMEELAEVAPVLLPEDVKVRMEGQRLHISVGGADVRVSMGAGDDDPEEPALEELEPMEPAGEAAETAGKIQGNGFVVEGIKSGEKGVKVVVRKADKKGKTKEKKLDLSRLAELAPFLDQEYLDQLVRSVDLSDLDGLEEVAPFLGRETLDYIVEQAEVEDLDVLAEMAPFLSSQTVDRLVSRCTAAKDFSTLEELAPFISSGTLDRLAENVQPDSIWEVVSIAPFFGQNALDKLVRKCEDAGEFDAIEELAPFLSESVLDELVTRYMEKGREEHLSDLYPFMGKQTLRKLAKHMMEQKDLDALEDIMPFV